MAQQSSTTNPDRYAKAGRKRGGIWKSALFALVGLIVFVAIVLAVDALMKPQLGGFMLLAVGIVLAIVPAMLWMVFFYLQDRLEPEPVGHVAQIFVIGLALAGAIGIPLTDQVFRAQDWLFGDTVSTIVGAVFVRGAIEAFILYATVRYFIFNSPEFDERSDGVVYGTAAGLGYATALNLQFILSNGGAALGAGELYVAEVALAYAAFGGLLGYFLGRAKMQQDPIWWLPLGLVLTALLNGLFIVLLGQLETGTLAVGAQSIALPSLTGFLLAGALAVIVTVIVSALVNRDISLAASGKQPAATGDPTVGDRKANWAVIGVFAVMLVIGAIAWNSATNGTVAFDKDGIRGAYPSIYRPATRQGEALRVADKTGTGAEFAVRVVALKPGQGPKAAPSLLAAERGAESLLYKVLRTDEATVNGKPSTVQEFAYVDSGGLTGALPQVIQGVDYIVATEDGKAVVITLYATPDTIGAVQPSFEQFVKGLSF